MRSFEVKIVFFSLILDFCRTIVQNIDNFEKYLKEKSWFNRLTVCWKSQPSSDSCWWTIWGLRGSQTQCGFPINNTWLSEFVCVWYLESWGNRNWTRLKLFLSQLQSTEQEKIWRPPCSLEIIDQSMSFIWKLYRSQHLGKQKHNVADLDPQSYGGKITLLYS